MPETEIPEIPEIPIVAPDRRRGCLDYLKSKFVIPAAVLASLGIGTVWYMSSCNKTDQPEQTQENVQQTAPQPVELTAEQKTIDNHIASAKIALTNLAQDGYSREELLNVVIPGYKNLKEVTDKVKDAPELLKGNLKQVLSTYWGVIDKAFGESDVFGYAGIITDRSGGVGNLGATTPMKVGKGKDIADAAIGGDKMANKPVFTEEMKIAMLEKSQPTWKPFSQRKGIIPRGEVYEALVPVVQEAYTAVLSEVGKFGKNCDPKSHYLDLAGWERLNDGKESNLELRVTNFGPHLGFRTIYNGHSE